jgi:hypothetical protein
LLLLWLYRWMEEQQIRLLGTLQVICDLENHPLTRYMTEDGKQVNKQCTLPLQDNDPRRLAWQSDALRKVTGAAGDTKYEVPAGKVTVDKITTTLQTVGKHLLRLQKANEAQQTIGKHEQKVDDAKAVAKAVCQNGQVVYLRNNLETRVHFLSAQTFALVNVGTKDREAIQRALQDCRAFVRRNLLRFMVDTLLIVDNADDNDEDYQEEEDSEEDDDEDDDDDKDEDDEGDEEVSKSDDYKSSSPSSS